MQKPQLTFAELDRRIAALPDGPAAILSSPAWLTACTLVGTIGVVFGLLPSLLVLFLEPKLWMLWMARVGLLMVIVGYAPGIARGFGLFTVSLWRWRVDQAAQLDHDLSQLRELKEWLGSFDATSIEDRLRFGRQSQERLTAKLGLLAGALDKLGIAPLLVALAIQIKAYEKLGDIPYWQAVVGLFLAITYMIAFVGSLMRIRLQLYEMLLNDATPRAES